VPRSATKLGGTHIDPALARRYAAALHASARKRGILDRVEADLVATAALLAAEAAFRDFLLSPEVLDEHKDEILARTLKPRLAPLSFHFLLLLFKKRRLDHLAAIHDELVALVEAERGIWRAQVTTAVPMSQEHQAEIRAKLEAVTGKQIKLDLDIDPDILGGVVLVMNGKIVDGSVRRGLDRLRDELAAVRVI
jgi:F-type H+-transporting ATPase subunit delta